MALEDIVKYKDLNQLHRKFNLLSSWIQLKFPNDPSFPRSLIQDSAEDVIVGDTEYSDPVIEKLTNFHSNTNILKIVNIESILENNDGDIENDIDIKLEAPPPSKPARNRKQDLSRLRFSDCSYQSETKPCTVNINPIDNTEYEDASNLPTEDEFMVATDDESKELVVGVPFNDENDEVILPLRSGDTRNYLDHSRNSCTECHLNFRDSKKLLLHKYKVHILPVAHGDLRRNRRKRLYKSYRCLSCEKIFSFKKSLEKHVSKYHSDVIGQQALEVDSGETENTMEKTDVPNSNIACPFCQKMYQTRKYLRMHIRQKHGDEDAAQDALTSFADHRVSRGGFCEICKKSFKSFESFKRHFVRYHPEVFEQKVQSGEIRKNKKRLPVTSNLNDRVKCPECPKMILHSYMETHMREMHAQLDKSLYSSKAGRTSKRKTKLIPRVDSDSDKWKYKCAHCPYTTKYESVFRNHNARFHDTKRADHECSICGESFKMVKTLNRHVMQVHESHQMYHCNLCEKTFNTSTHLKYHVKTHQNPNTKKQGLGKERKTKRKGRN